jgi:hypothetical protein
MQEAAIRFEELCGEAAMVLTRERYAKEPECTEFTEALGLWLQNHPERKRLFIDCRYTLFLHSCLIGPLRMAATAMQARGGDVRVIVHKDEPEGGIRDMLFLTKTAPNFLQVATLG